ncbi:diguanylate cyclase [Shewanella sp. CG12_big_fil_rev_8_21_14_0_65_47_15]|uniref:sensor domain-containing phosphodiesterase n=1 Tax=Shewanella sp. CG12_big_fil_rev_8_21_14_0_65_47_15 TaxID=1975537 RepID=UPI000CB80966|nr:diguanylate cyclase [Shewanella sp. CG12_big_fil_rev_8_21_14_0_65_47_15]PIW59776.1 MAG: bifunctional diguanylate cyclase/phosphodiesterase [Shewanella sp. CG12_big_fil_rev_8_21_14_0_65_47_15]
MFKDEDETAQPRTKEIERLEKRLIRLKYLAHKYKRAEIIQNALLELSNIATQVSSLEEFYLGVHQHLKQLISADNFFIATLDVATGGLTVPFFADEKDAHPAQLYPEQSLSTLLQQGLTGYVFKTGKALLCDDTLVDELVAAGQIVNLGSPCHLWLGVPIRHEDMVTGVLVVQTYDTNVHYGDIEVELMTFICHHISGVMERLKHQEQLEQAIQQRTKELSQAYDKLKQEVYERRRAERLQKSLFEIAELANSSADNPDFYAQLHNVIRHLIPANNCYIALLNEEETHLTFPFYVSQLGNGHPGTRPLQDGLTEYVLKHKRPLLLDQNDINALIVSGELYTKAPSLNHTQTMHQWIGIPLFIHDQVRGALTIYSFSMTQNYQIKDLELLTFVSQHIGTAIEKKLSAESLQRSYEELEEKVIARTRALAELNKDLEKEIRQRRNMEAKLVHDAKHDALTGLPNRAMFMERLNQAIKHVRRHSLDQFALLFIDLDRFKQINDTLGHIEGDRFLIETASRLRSCIRSNDTLARLGGDEFVILLDCISSIDDAKDVSERVIQKISQPYRSGTIEFNSGASIGITISGNHRLDTSESMLRNADTAMYQAKANGKGCYVIFDDSSSEQAMQDAAFENDFRLALQAHALQLSYSPIVDLQTQQPYALECRLFWEHPQRGTIQQEQLSVLAEQANLTVELDKYTITALDSTYIELLRCHGDQLDLHLMLSSQHLKHKHVLRSLKNTLKQTRLNLNRLWLFFNEKSLVQETENHINGFALLQKLGVNLGISHYGSGHSSLNSLLFLPIKALKLDTNIAKQLQDEQHIKLISAYQKTASTLDLLIFAGGLTNQEQIQIFSSLGYQFGQGGALTDTFTLLESPQQVCA